MAPVSDRNYAETTLDDDLTMQPQNQQQEDDPQQQQHQQQQQDHQHPHHHLLKKKFNPGSMALVPAPEKVRVGALILGRWVHAFPNMSAPYIK